MCTASKAIHHMNEAAAIHTVMSERKTKESLHNTDHKLLSGHEAVSGQLSIS